MRAPKHLRPTATLLVRNAVLATCDRGPSDPGLLPGGAVAIDERRIVWVGHDRDLEDAVDVGKAQALDARGGLVTPGLVDSHTHLIFVGDRSGEFALRCTGRRYFDTALRGGGIAVTTRETQAASDDVLLAIAAARVRRLLAQGVTTIEVKSGYGATIGHELRLLRVIHELARVLEGEVTVIPTVFACAIPPERLDDRACWVREIADELIPAAARERLAVSCDVFLDPGAFAAGEARLIIEAGIRAGLAPHLHAEYLNLCGGARLAADLRCASADHLDLVDDEGIEALAGASVVAGLTPLSSMGLGADRYAPARRLLDAGVPLALASNFNPGTAMSENTGLVLSLACLKMGLSPAEALVAYTAGGARSLRRGDLGRLSPGCEADLVVWGCTSPEHLAWHLAVSHVLMVVKRGRVVHEAQPGAAVDCR